MPSLRFISKCLLVLMGAASPLSADPQLTSWMTSDSTDYAQIFQTTSGKSSGTTVTTWPSAAYTNAGGGQATPAYSDIQRIVYSSKYVYVYTTGLASYTMGPWLTPNNQVFTFWPSDIGAIHKIPRTPSIPTTKAQIQGGSSGVWVNGVALYNTEDGQSYSVSGGTISAGGSGIWNRLASVGEGFNFDPAFGHQAHAGEYHHHLNPMALRYQLGDNVSYSSSSHSYSESGTPTQHSPILGWANDGLPIYGPYGYSSALDSTSGVRRMVTGYILRDGTDGSTDLNSTGRTTLPSWAVSLDGGSQTLTSSDYGPSVSTTYPLGTFCEDYDYLGNLGKTQGVDFDLDETNARYCVTPDFPNGTYAYFVALDSSSTSTYPDVLGRFYEGTPVIGFGEVTSISESTTTYDSGGPAAAIVIQATASGSGVELTWNSSEGATYEVDSSPDNSTWTAVDDSITSAGLSTSYTTASVANYFRVTLTAIATYDTTGTYGTAVGTTSTYTYNTPTVAPSITTQPSSQTVTAGSNVSFSVVASGSATLTYQWQLGGTNIPGATSASYSITGAQSSNAGSYTCTVSNGAGSATSTAATLTVNPASSAPSITTQPLSQTVMPGSNVMFSVVASGTPSPTYQWKLGGSAISGATSASYSITNAQPSNAGNYTCTVSNSAGSVTSAVASLTVSSSPTAPSITTQPSSQTVTAGSSATFMLAANGTAPLAYQWKLSGSAISGATSASYSIGNAQAANAGNYTCTVSNSAGSVTSSVAVLTVNSSSGTGPSISSQPSNATVAAGSSTAFTVVALGTAPLAYQWEFNGTPISGATGSTLSLSNLQSSNAGNYNVLVSNSAGQVASATASLTVTAGLIGTAPSITSQPQSQTVSSGSSVVFSVSASGSATLSYAWALDGTPLSDGNGISGSATSQLSISSATGANAGYYTVTVTNSAGNITSAETTLAIATLGAPSITQQPSSQTMASGSTVVFSATAETSSTTNLARKAEAVQGSGVSYQWYWNNAIIAGATTSTYLINDATAANNGSYTCTATNSAGSVTSSPATLTVVNTTTPGHLINISARSFVGTGGNVLIAGFVVQGSSALPVLVRSSGPALTSDGVSGVLPDPQLQLYSGSTNFASNAGWGGNALIISTAAAVGATAWTNPNSLDSALVESLNPGGYTGITSGDTGSTGVALAEVYDATPAGTYTSSSPHLINISARSFVGTGSNVLIAGFVIGGSTSKTVLIRASGPALTSDGVSGVLSDPQLQLYSGSTVIASNAGWGGNAQIVSTASAVGASAWADPSSLDSALLVTLPPGGYTAIISGVSGDSGVSLAEVYDVP